MLARPARMSTMSYGALFQIPTNITDTNAVFGLSMNCDGPMPTHDITWLTNPFGSGKYSTRQISPITAGAAAPGRNTAERTNHRDLAWPSSSNARKNPTIIDPKVWPNARTTV